ncbi:MAG: hypothetical protein MUE73_21170 [Planctomycetes bacterium]|jgi:hypothetical protein|nr:hypothetical protein [Planctomycetota bacterium]
MSLALGGAAVAAGEGRGASLRDLDSAQSGYRTGQGVNTVFLGWKESQADVIVRIAFRNRLTGSELVFGPFLTRVGDNGYRVEPLPAGRYVVEVRTSEGAVLGSVLQDVLDAQPFAEVTELDCAQGQDAGDCVLAVSWCQGGPPPGSYRILLDGILALEILDGSSAREASIPVSGAGRACVGVVGLSRGADISLEPPVEGKFQGQGVVRCLGFSCGGGDSCPSLPGIEKCNAGCRTPGGFRLCQTDYGGTKQNGILALWEPRDDYEGGVRLLVDGVDHGLLGGGSLGTTIPSLDPGEHGIRIVADCGGATSQREGSIELLEAGPFPEPVRGAIACEWVDADPPVTTVQWVRGDVEAESVAVYLSRDGASSLIATLPGDATRVDVRGTRQDDGILLQFFRPLGCAAYGSERIECQTGIQNPFVRGDCGGQGQGVDISSAVVGLNYLFLGGPAPPCLAACDSNDDAAVDISDSVYLLDYLFLGGPAPVGWTDADDDGVPDPTCEAAPFAACRQPGPPCGE